MAGQSKFLKLGLTGGIASGKSTVAGMLRDFGCGVIDADRCARDVVAPGTEGLASVLENFGEGVIAPDGSLNREIMRAIVFADPAKRKILESITHPLIAREVLLAMERFEREGRPGVIEAALIFEAKTAYGLDAVIAVVAGRENQAARLRERSRWSAFEIEGVLDAQMSDEERIRKADHVIHNFGTLENLALSVRDLWHRLGK